MKRIVFLLVLTFLTFSTVLLAQEVKGENFPQKKSVELADSKTKIAFINESEFETDKTGIPELIQLRKSIDLLIPVLSDRATRRKITYIESDLKNESLKPDIRAAKKKELESLKREDEIVKKQFWVVLTKPVYVRAKPTFDNIERILTHFEQRNNAKILFYKDFIDSPSSLFVDTKNDITNSFISFYNTKLQTNPNAVFNCDVMEGKVAVINTTSFEEAKNGIGKYAAVLKKYNEDLAKLVPEYKNFSYEEKIAWHQKNVSFDKDLVQVRVFIGTEISSFAKENGIVAVFDSSRELPSKIKSLPMEDITQDFIAYFNKRNL